MDGNLTLTISGTDPTVHLTVTVPAAIVTDKAQFGQWVENFVTHVAGMREVATAPATGTPPAS